MLFFDALTRFRQRLADGEVLLGPAVHFTDPQASDALAENSDFIWYDIEHHAMSIEALRNHLMVARNRGIPGIVRVSASDTEFYKTILDVGASGVVVPQVYSAEETRRVVDACRYPTQGARGFYPLISMNYGRMDLNEHCRLANENVFVTIMVETAQAVEEIEDILAIDGLDSVVLGLMDLSGSYGVLGQTTHPKVVEATDKVIAAAKAAGKPVGTGQDANADVVCDLIRRGVQWVQTGSDVTNMVQFYDDYLATVHGRLADFSRR